MDRNIWNILLVDPDRDDFLIIQDYLAEAKGGKFMVAWEATFEAAWERLSGQRYAIILVADQVNDQPGVEFIRQAISRGYQVPFLLITDQESYEIDMQAMQAGAMDYLNKEVL